MNTILEEINSAGLVFVKFALPMLIQSGILIAVLLLADLLLRKKVRAVFRYWLWMLVLIKLVLPTTLSSPVSLGSWFGDKLASIKVNDTSIVAQPVNMSQVIETETIPLAVTPQPDVRLETAPPLTVEPVTAEAVMSPAVSMTPLTWQGIVFMVWAAVVAVMGLLLLQRAIFVTGLVAHAQNPTQLMNDAFNFCCGQMGIKRKVGLKVSANTASPAVCGLFKPVILVPENLAPTLGSSRLRPVLLHELAHIKRGDLWINLIQTILQIIYFYNPLLWLANFIIRRIREQAVDETVQVAMGANAQQYPQTLVEVAKVAFNRPVLSLRLIGVVESKSALKGRIERMLSHPIPKTAKLGIIGLITLLIFAAVVLPMAKAKSKPPEFIIKGLVTDAETGRPIAGAKVGDDKYAGGQFWTTTDANGSYSYNTWYEEHNIKCEASGYKTKNTGFGTKLFGSEKEKVIDFALEPLDSPENVSDALNQPSSNQNYNEFEATLPNGVTVELVGVCDYPKGKARCWRPDGSESQKQIYAAKWNKKNPQPDEIGVMLKLSGPEDLSFAWNEIDGANGYEGSCKVMDNQGNQLKDFKAAIAKMAKGKTKTTVRIGIATKPWRTEAAHSGRGMTTTGDKDILFSQAFETDSFVGITVSSQWHKDCAERIVAIDTNGQIRTTGNIGSVASGEIDQMTAKFHGLKLKDIAEFQFQTRSYQWVTFNNVSLKPGHKTDVRVDIEGAGKVTDKDKMTSENLTAQGWELWRQRKLAEAEEAFKKAVSKDRTNANAWNGLGWAQQNQGKPVNAKASFEKCLKIQPKHAAALNGLGWIAKAQGRTDEAIAHWEKAIEAAPSATAALNGLATTYMELKDYDKAVKYYEMWLKVEPDNTDAKAGLEKAKSQKTNSQASIEPAQENQLNEAVYKQLDQTIDLSGLTPNMPFGEAIALLKNSADPPLKTVVLWQALFDNADIDQSTPINMDAIPSTQLGTALKILLKSVSNDFAKLDYAVEDGVIFIGPVESLPAKFETRVYDISDLTGDIAGASNIARVIINTIEPDHWERANGKGTVDIYDTKLVIYQTLEIHKQIQDVLQNLRSSPTEKD